MGLMNDLFKRGYSFNAATGLKTGANLEDLVTRAVPVAGTQLVDQSTLEDYADAAVVDDAGDPVRRLRAVGHGHGPVVGVTNGMFAFDGWASGSPLSAGDLTNILTVNNTTETGILAAVDSQSAHIYCSMPGGATYRGHFTAKVRWNVVSSRVVNAAAISPWYSLLEPTFSSHFLSRATHPNGFYAYGGCSSVLAASGTTYYDYWLSVPFFGNYVGLTNLVATSASNLKILRWCVQGYAVDNI